MSFSYSYAPEAFEKNAFQSVVGTAPSNEGSLAIEYGEDRITGEGRGLTRGGVYKQ